MQLLTNNQGGRNRPIFYAKQDNSVLENYAIKIKFCKIEFFQLAISNKIKFLKTIIHH